MIAKENVRVKLIHNQNIIGTTAIGTLTSTHLIISSSDGHCCCCIACLWHLILIIIQVDDWVGVGKRDCGSKKDHSPVCQYTSLRYIRCLALSTNTTIITIIIIFVLCIPACDISGGRHFQPIPSLNMCQKIPQPQFLRQKMHNSRHLLICNKRAQIQKIHKITYKITRNYIRFCVVFGEKKIRRPDKC